MNIALRLLLLLLFTQTIDAQETLAFKELWKGPIFSDQLNEKYKQNFINCKLLSLGEEGKLFFWHAHRININYYHLFDLKTNQFESIDGALPNDWIIEKSENYKGYSYLPNKKSILLTSDEWGYQKSKEKAISWILNLEKKEWIPVKQDISMSDKSKDYHVGSFNEGAKIPIWHESVYDPVNKEVLLIGGGGVWGTVSKEEINVNKGDWIFDTSINQIRRVLATDKITKAKKWFPGQSGSWAFSESEETWSPTKQSIQDQLSGRILPAVAFDNKRKQILVHGGDDLGQCLNDTWAYNCTDKLWKKLETKNTPYGIAGAAMIYVPEKDLFLLIGGYAAGWNALDAIWSFNPVNNTWVKIKSKTPAKFPYASADYSTFNNKFYLAGIQQFSRNKTFSIFELSPTVLDFSPSEEILEVSNFHCEGWGSWKSSLFGNWAPSATNLKDREKELAILPANTWVKQKVPEDSVSRDWGISVYDIKSHKAFSWGGGHSHYPGAEVNTYDLLKNRWDVMNDVTNYNPIWLHGMVGGPPGVSFGGWSLLPSHARKSYGIDPISDSLVLYSDDVFSIKNNQFQSKMAAVDYSWNGPSNQVLYITTEDGLYSYACKDNNKTGVLQKANVSKGLWETVKIGGPAPHKEHHHGCYDSKRKRILYFTSNGDLWTFDIKSQEWQQEIHTGNRPKFVVPNSTYIPSMDSVLTVGAIEKKAKKESLIFYNLTDKKWMIAEYKGDSAGRPNDNGLLMTPVYDPTYNVVVRIVKKSSKLIDVLLMRVDPTTINAKDFTSEEDYK